MSKYGKHGPIAREAMAFILAGGRGSRLMELTDNRAKPAVYFGGKSRIIDFALSNALNSGVRRIAVATQYCAQSLIRHLQQGWNFLRVERNESMDILPASQNMNDNVEQWYLGTADAVYQNLTTILHYRPKYMIILAGDHIYKMDYELMLQEHVQTGADVTIGCLEVSKQEAKGFGVMAVNEQDRITMFVEKPADPPTMPGSTDHCLASMGIYVFETKLMEEVLRADAEDATSSHDFGKDIIPKLVERGYAHAHRFTTSCVRSDPEQDQVYWRDVGTLDAYWQTNVDLTDVVPALDLYDRNWPIWTYGEVVPPAKFVHDNEGRRGQAITSLISGGCIISGSMLRRTLLSTGVRVNSYGTLEEAVIMPYVTIGRHAKLSRVIIDRGVEIPEGLVVGEDPEYDAKHFRRTDNGVCLITRKMIANLEKNS